MLDAAIIAARFFQFASAAILFGSSLFYLYGVAPGHGGRTWPWRLLFAASAIGLASGFAWLDAEAVALSGQLQSAADPGFLWSIVSETQFGGGFLLRIIVSLMSLACFAALPARHPRALYRVQCTLSALLLASFAWTGHGVLNAGAAGALHAGADIVHLLAAGIWIGALLPLTILLVERGAGDAEAADAERALVQFSGIGTAMVAALVLSGLVNSWFLIGPSHVEALVASAYGLVLIAKLCLFAGMLGFAAANRFRLTPRLKAALESPDRTANAVAALKKSVMFETALGFLVLAAVAVLGTLPPPASGG